MKDTLIVNLFGEPGAGKSTGAAYVFAMLKMAGVDMTTEKPVADALALFGELVAELEALV